MDNLYELLGLIAVLLFFYFTSRGTDCNCEDTYEEEDPICTECNSSNMSITKRYEIDKVFTKEYCNDCEYSLTYSEKKD